MDPVSIGKAVLLALVEGATEFIPVSSTGHQLLVGHFIGFHSPNNTFEVLIQLGAILAILTVYFRRLVGIATALPTNPQARRFVIGILVAFLPAAIIGGLFSKVIKAYLFNPWIVCATLVAGGLVLLVLDDTDLEVKKTDVYDFSLPMDLKIGIFQCLAMIPGVSRSGATIVGAMLMGADKRSATEFSFYLAMPTMAGALRQGPVRQLQIPLARRCRPDRDRLHRVVRLGPVRGPRAARLRVPPWVPAVRLVADHRRRPGLRRVDHPRITILVQRAIASGRAACEASP